SFVLFIILILFIATKFMVRHYLLTCFYFNKRLKAQDIIKAPIATQATFLISAGLSYFHMAFTPVSTKKLGTLPLLISLIISSYSWIRSANNNGNQCL